MDPVLHPQSRDVRAEAGREQVDDHVRTGAQEPLHGLRQGGVHGLATHPRGPGVLGAIGLQALEIHVRGGDGLHLRAAGQVVQGGLALHADAKHQDLHSCLLPGPGNSNAWIIE